jgi:hypothetical protein
MHPDVQRKALVLVLDCEDGLFHSVLGSQELRLVVAQSHFSRPGKVQILCQLAIQAVRVLLREARCH